MNLRQYLPVMLAVIIATTSCKKNSDGETGTTAADSLYLTCLPGFVPEPDNHYYKIANGMVVEDTSRVLHTDPANYNYTLPDKNNALAASLLNIPNKMVRNNGTSYNNDRMADCASYNVKAFINGKEYSWHLQDCYEDNKHVEEYIIKLNAAKAEFQK